MILVALAAIGVAVAHLGFTIIGAFFLARLLNPKSEI
jgi:hypothetical protein